MAGNEKLTCPICGEPTRVYMGNARKDRLCGKHADMLKAGDLLQIRFPKLPQVGETVEIEFSVQSQQAGVLLLKIGNTDVSTQFKSPEFKKITVRLKEKIVDDTVAIQVVYNSAEAFFIADHQRYYQASSCNGKTLEGELVVRLTR